MAENVINEQCRRLASLLYSRPTDANRREVEYALTSKWEGVQVWAGRVLATWGDRRSIDALRLWLERSLDKEAGWALRGQAVRSLCECYESSDIPWMLDLYFAAAEKDNLLRHELLPFIRELPIEGIETRIHTERRSPSPTRKAAAEIASRVLAWRSSLRGSVADAKRTISRGVKKRVGRALPRSKPKSKS